MMLDNFINWKYLDLWKAPINAFSSTAKFDIELDSKIDQYVKWSKLPISICRKTTALYPNIQTAKNICPTCSHIGHKANEASVIESWKCNNCLFEWMTINELKNE